MLRRILYICIWICDAANILTSITFLKKIRAIYSSNIVVLSDGAQYYKHHENIKIKHDIV
ncbi:MAG: hypothetical protein QXP91_12785 [Candidatus Methanomethylicia archaeon]